MDPDLHNLLVLLSVGSLLCGKFCNFPLQNRLLQFLEASTVTSGMMSKQTSEIEEMEMTSRLLARHVSGLPASVIQELTATFKDFDANRDGKISQRELGSVLRCLREDPSAADLARMIAEVDVDGDGYVDLQEFIHLNTKGIEGTTGENGCGSSSFMNEMESAFHVFDIDRDGFISAHELYRVLSGLGDDPVTLEECRYMIKSVNNSGDERVDFADFQRMMSDGFVYS